jgi:hypothetical protein
LAAKEPLLKTLLELGLGIKPQPRRSQKPTNTFSPQLEALEDRLLMASGLGILPGPVGFPKLDPTAAWIDQNIHDPTLHTLVRQDEIDHVLSRNEMIEVLAQAWTEAFQSSTVSPTLYADLEAIVHNPGILGMPDYVHVLANKVVNHDQANAHFEGTALGDLQVGNMFSSQLVRLTYKWFLGADHPSVSDPSFTYRPASGTLFGSGGSISYADIRQGASADCWFLAALEETAIQAPAIINSMFIDNGDNTYTVRFYHGSVPDYVTVDKFLPTNYAPDGAIVLAYTHSLQNFDRYGSSQMFCNTTTGAN